MADPEVLDPENKLVVLEQKLTGREALDALVQHLKDAAFEFTPDDEVLMATVESYDVTDADAYTRGYALLAELGKLEDRIVAYYARFDKPLNLLVKTVRDNKGPQTKQVEPLKKALSRSLGQWKLDRDARDRAEKEARQREADAKAKAEQQAKAEALQRVAEAETNPALAASFQAEAEAVRNVEVSAAPVEEKSSVPKIPGGQTRIEWIGEVTDLKMLIRAWLDGKCFLVEQDLIDGIQSYLNDQASHLQGNLSQAFPGTVAKQVPKGIARKK